MKIKTIPILKKQDRVNGQWVNGRFFPNKDRALGRLAQLGKKLKKRTDSEAVSAWKESDSNEPTRRSQ
jgi:hypothetical protein